MKRHGLNGPSTFRRNTTNNPIDGIWTSPNIDISAGGYFAYDSVFLNTDHRCLWIDITFITAFGHNMPIIHKPKARRLHCKDPRIVNNFVKLYKKMILRNNLPTKIKRLKNKCTHPLSPSEQYTYEEIDASRCKATSIAEKKCRKLRMGQVAFSPALQIASRKINAWSLLQKKAKGMRISSRYLSRMLRKASIPIAARTASLESMEDRLKSAYQEYYSIKKNDKATRDTFQDNLAEALAAEGNLKKATVQKVLKHREKQRATARKIKFLRGKLKTGSTMMVSVQSADGSSQDITSKFEMEQAIMMNNQEKYKQSFHTPFMQPSLRSDFGFKGLTTASLAVLGGVYEPDENIDEYTKAFLEELVTPQAVRDLGTQTMELSLEIYISFWKKSQ